MGEGRARSVPSCGTVVPAPAACQRLRTSAPAPAASPKEKTLATNRNRWSGITVIIVTFPGENGKKRKTMWFPIEYNRGGLWKK
jgi:hypothetical protein